MISVKVSQKIQTPHYLLNQKSLALICRLLPFLLTNAVFCDISFWIVQTLSSVGELQIYWTLWIKFRNRGTFQVNMGNSIKPGQIACPMLVGCAWVHKISERRLVVCLHMFRLVKKKKTKQSTNFQLNLLWTAAYL